MAKQFLLFLLVSSTCLLTVSAQEEQDVKALRDEKAFSLFTVVNFQNQGCRSTLTRNGGAETSLNGTCYTSTECTDNGGRAYGNCASGFGVCCVFIVDAAAGGTVKENCTYMRNDKFPNVYSTTTGVVYKIEKVNPDVCQIRLDFETFQTLGPTLTTEVGGGVCNDMLTITASSGFAVPEICGLMTGQHMYIHVGEGASDVATMTFAFSTTADTTRKWEIKATQLFCWQDSKAPDGCLQYYTTITGRYTSFNFGNSATNVHLRNQNQNICIRQNVGYCCVKHNLCPEHLTADTPGNVQAFALDLMTGTAQAIGAETDSLCCNDYLGIPGSTAFCGGAGGTELHSQYCGISFSGSTQAGTPAAAPNPAIADKVYTGACDCTLPFTAEIITNALSDNGDGTPANIVAISGLCIDFQQQPC